jgi:hypothetical protein
LHHHVVVGGLTLLERFIEGNHKSHVYFILHGKHEELREALVFGRELVGGAMETD